MKNKWIYMTVALIMLAAFTLLGCTQDPSPSQESAPAETESSSDTDALSTEAENAAPQENEDEILPLPFQQPANPTVEWTGTFASTEGFNDWFLGACETQNGFVGAGVSTDKEGNQTGYLIAYGKDGEKLWEKASPGNYFMSVANTPSGLLVSANTTDETDIEFGRILLFDENGEQLWSLDIKGLEGVDMSFLKYATTRENGNFLIPGSTASTDGNFEGTSGGGFILEVNPAGELVKIHSFGEIGIPVIEGVTITSDGGAVAAGILSASEDDSNVDAAIIKLDADMNVVWQSSVKSTGGDWGVCAYETENGEYILGGSTDGKDGDFGAEQAIGGTLPFLARLDAQGTVLWAHLYPFGTTAEEGIWANSCEKGSNGEFLLSGMLYKDGYVGSYGGAVAIDADGNELAKWLYAAEGEESINHVYGASDGGYFAAGGFHTEKGDSDGAIIKYSSLSNS